MDTLVKEIVDRDYDLTIEKGDPVSPFTRANPVAGLSDILVAVIRNYPG